MNYPTPAQIEILAEIEAVTNAIPPHRYGVRETYAREQAIAEAYPKVLSLIALANAIAGQPCSKRFLGLVDGHARYFATAGVGDMRSVYVCRGCGMVTHDVTEYDV